MSLEARRMKRIISRGKNLHFFKSVERWTSLIWQRDLATYRHTLNVAELASNIADDLGLDGKVADIVRAGSLLHDIGKISICRSILDKPGMLNEMEYTCIKDHTVFGHDLIKTFSEGLPDGVLEIVLYHHEKNGGGGYHRLPTVPAHVEIVMACDIAAAMQEHRAYRPGHPFSVGISELKHYRWNSDIVDVIDKNPGAFFLDYRMRQLCLREDTWKRIS